MTRWTTTFTHVPGYSAVDHLAGELMFEAGRVAGASYATRRSALAGGERAVARAAHNLRAKYTRSDAWRGCLPEIAVDAAETT